MGISLEGTVDIIEGNQLCPHHFVQNLRPNGPAAKTGLLKSGDELLQANDKILYGESYITVTKSLNKFVDECNNFLRLIFCRKIQQVRFTIIN